MDAVDIVAVALGAAYIGYVVYQALVERAALTQIKINNEIDNLHK
jgi:hypothetical protein